MGRSPIIRMPCVHPCKLKQHLLNEKLSHFNCLHWDTLRGKGERCNPANTGQIKRKQGLKNYYTLRDASAYIFLVGRHHGSWQLGLNGVLIVCKSFFSCHSGTLLERKKNQFLFTQVAFSYLDFRLCCFNKDLRSIWLYGMPLYWSCKLDS